MVTVQTYTLRTMCDVNTEELALVSTELFTQKYISKFRFMKCNEIILMLSLEKVMIMLLIKLFGNVIFIRFDNWLTLIGPT